MLVNKAARVTIFAGRNTDGKPVLAELHVALNNVIAVTKEIALDRDVNGIDYNRALEKLCISQYHCVTIFDANYIQLQKIERDQEMAEWMPQQVLLLDENILLVRAICRLTSYYSYTAQEFLHCYLDSQQQLIHAASLKFEVDNVLAATGNAASQELDLPNAILVAVGNNRPLESGLADVSGSFRFYLVAKVKEEAFLATYLIS